MPSFRISRTERHSSVFPLQALVGWLGHVFVLMVPSLIFINVTSSIVGEAAAAEMSVSVVDADRFMDEGSGLPAADEAKAAAMTFEFEILSSPDGHTPNVSIRYNPSIRNGLLGAGWSLSTARSITVHGPNGGAATGHVERDSYRVDGEDLFETGTLEYERLRRDGVRFTRVAPSSGWSYWTAEHYGRKEVYGNSATAQCVGVISRSQSTCLIDEWLLTEEIDEWGNAIDYLYDHTHTPPLLTEIRYNQDSATRYFAVVFDYEDRPDDRWDCSHERCERMSKRLAAVTAGVVDPQMTAVYRYDLDYTISSTGNQSLLSAIRQTGIDANGQTTSNEIPRRRFTYEGSQTNWDPPAQVAVLKEDMSGAMALADQDAVCALHNAVDLTSPSQATIETSFVDVNGDALPDLLVFAKWQTSLSDCPSTPENQTQVSGEEWRVFLNVPSNGAPTFVHNTRLSDQLFNFFDDVGSHDRNLIDLDGDGYLDVIRHGHPVNGPAAMLGSPYGFREDTEFDEDWMEHLSDASFADINGDGTPDIVHQDAWAVNTQGRLGMPFFETAANGDLVTIPIHDPLLAGQNYGPTSAGWGEACMQHGDPGMPPFEDVAVDDDNEIAIGTSFYPRVDDPTWHTLEKVAEEWIWRNTSHADVNGDGFADRIVMVEWLNADCTYGWYNKHTDLCEVCPTNPDDDEPCTAPPGKPEQYDENGNLNPHYSVEYNAWVERHQEVWKTNGVCGGEKKVYLGDGTGRFHDLAQEELENPATAYHEREIQYDANQYASYSKPMNHFGLVDVDGDGRAEALSRCNGDDYGYAVDAVFHAGNDDWFDCDQTTVATPAKWQGALPLGGGVQVMIDVDGDGFADVIRGPLFAHNVDLVGTTASDLDQDETVRWHRNTRSRPQNFLKSVMNARGATYALQWAYSAQSATFNGPNNVPVLQSIQGPNGLFTFAYDDGGTGNGRFTGWGTVTTQGPSGASTVQTFGTSLALQGHPRTDETYWADGSLKRIKVYVPDLVQTFWNAPPAPLPDQYQPRTVRMCTFEMQAGDSPYAADRNEFVDRCEEFNGETASAHSVIPSAEATIASGMTPWEIAFRNKLIGHVAYGRPLHALLDIDNISVETSEKLWRAYDATRGHVNRVGRGPLNDPGLSGQLTNHGEPRVQQLWVSQELEAALAALPVKSVLDDVMNEVSGTTATPSSLGRHRFYVTEASWLDVNQIHNIVYYRDATTEADSRKVGYDYYSPTSAFDWPRLSSIRDRDVNGATEKVIQFSDSGAYGYLQNTWRERTELPRDEQPVSLGTATSAASRVTQRDFDTRGRLTEFLDPGVVWERQLVPQDDDYLFGVQRHSWGFCGLQSWSQGNARRTFTYDGFCNLISVATDSGLVETHQYDQFMRVSHTVSSEMLNNGQHSNQPSISFGYRIFDDSGNNDFGPAEVLARETELGDWTLTKTYLDQWDRPARLEVCEWDRTACPVGTDPRTCTWANDLDEAFTCDADPTSFWVHRRFWYHSETGLMTGETDWYDGHGPIASATQYAYDEFHRQVQVEYADGRSVQTRRGLGWMEHEGEGRITRLSINTLRVDHSVWDAANQDWIAQSQRIYDRFKRLKTESDVLGNTTHFEYDGFGRQSEVKTPNTSVQTCSMNAPASIPTRTTSFFDVMDRRTMTIDPQGNKTIIKFDLLGRVERVRRKESGPNGATEVLETHQYVDDVQYPNRTIRSSDGIGNWTTTYLLPTGEPWKVQRPDGSEILYSFDRRGLLQTASEAFDGSATVRTTEYDHLDRPIRETLVFGNGNPAISTIDYSPRGEVVRTVDPDGQAFHFTYDEVGRPLTVRLGTSPSISRLVDLYHYDSRGRVDYANHEGALTRYYYDDLDHLTEVRQGYDESSQTGLVTTRAEYDAAHRLTAVIDDNGLRREFTPDAYGRVTQTQLVTDTGTVLSFAETSYDVMGRPVREVDEEGRVGCTDYDFMGRKVSESPPGGSTTTFSYQRGGVPNPFHPNGPTLRSESMTATSAEGRFETTLVDGLGRVHMEMSATRFLVHRFDQGGRLSTTEQHDPSHPGSVLREKGYGYVEASARLSQQTDWVAPGSSAACLTNPSSCASAVTTALLTDAGRIRDLEDGNGQHTIFTYRGDGSGLVDTVHVQDVTKYEYNYDPFYPIVASYREGITNPIDVTIDRERYVRTKSILREDHLTGLESERVEWEYNNVGRTISEKRFLGATEKSRTEYGYDAAGYLSSYRVAIPDPVSPGGYESDLTLDIQNYKNGFARRLTYPSGNQVQYDYIPGTWRLQAVQRGHTSNPSLSETIYEVAQYDQDGRALQIRIAPSLPGQAEITRVFETATNRLDSRSLNLGTGVHEDQFEEHYRYDALGYLDRIEQTVSVGTRIPVTSEYFHDLRGYIGSERHTRADGHVDSFSYTYDPSGNRLDMSETHGTAAPRSLALTYGASDKVQSIDNNGLVRSITWDDYGRQTTSSSGYELVYSLHHELTSVHAGTVLIERSEFSGSGQRIASFDTANQATYYLPGAGGNVWETVEHTGDVVDNVFVDGDVVVQLDGHGNATSVVSGIDGNPTYVLSTGEVISQPLNAWGMQRDGAWASSEGLGFHQMQQSVDTRLNVAGARVYDPLVGRFTAPDPLGFAGGGMDLYRYAGNSPLTYHDRGGLSLQPHDDHGGSMNVPNPKVNANEAGGTNSTEAGSDSAAGSDETSQNHESGSSESDNSEQDTSELAEEAGETQGPAYLYEDETMQGGYESVAFYRDGTTVHIVQHTYWREQDNQDAEESTDAEVDSTDGRVYQDGSAELEVEEGQGKGRATGRSVAKELHGTQPQVLDDEVPHRGTGNTAWPSSTPGLSQVGQIALQAVDIGLDLLPIPFLSSVKEGVNIFYGKNVITGEEYTTFDYVVGVASITVDVATLGVAGGYVAAGIKAGVKGGSKVAKRVGEGIEVAGDLVTRHCFVAGTGVVTAEGSTSIESVEKGMRVLAYEPSDGSWVEVADETVDRNCTPTDPEVQPSLPRWALPVVVARTACGERGVETLRRDRDRVTSWTKWAMPAMVALAACGGEPELPAADEVVQVYDARTGDWFEAAGDELEVGDTWLDDGWLHRWTAVGVEDRGAATVEELAEADAKWRAEAATPVPGTDEWVLVLGEADVAGHWKLGAVEAGERFAFQGRVFETADADGDGLIEVRPTELVLSRVVETFVRKADTVIDAEIQYEDGTVEVISGTPEHPFYVPALKDWVALGELVEGTELHVDSAAGAKLVGKAWRQGDFTVYNFEVENQHNYFVRAPGSEAAAVLVHNYCFLGSLTRNAGSFLRNKMKRISNQAAAGGNRGVAGSVSGEQAEQLGRAWVGDGAREFGGGMGLISEDGTRVFRRPSAKRGVNPATNEPWSQTGKQSNFEVRSQTDTGRWQVDSNVHLDVE